MFVFVEIYCTNDRASQAAVSDFTDYLARHGTFSAVRKIQAMIVSHDLAGQITMHFVCMFL